MDNEGNERAQSKLGSNEEFPTLDIRRKHQNE